MTKNIAHITLLIIIALFGFSSVTSAFAQEFLLQVTNNRITLKTENTPLQQVLSAIETQSEIKIQFFLKADDRVTAELDGIPLAEGIDLLLQRYNHAITYRKLSDNVFAITDIFILSRSIKTDELLDLRLSKAQEDKQATVFTIQDQGHGEIPLYNSNPLDNAPLNSMRGLDPLARFEPLTPRRYPHSAELLILPSPGQLPLTN